MKTRLGKSLERSLCWFRESGVMRPADGSWGVGERVFLTEENSATEQAYRCFPAWTDYGSYSIIEQRRADCCMETAFLFLLAGDDETAYHMLDFLYNRSGLLLRFQPDDVGEGIEGAWFWSHIVRSRGFWFDDNGWMCILQLMIGKLRPEWDREFGMREWALKLAGILADAFEKRFQTGEPEGIFPGRLHLPHWGSMLVFALARASQEKPEPRYREIIDRYHRFLLEKHDTLTASEFGYAVTGAVMAHRVFGDVLSLEVAELFAGKLLERMDLVTGNIPAEHYEAPVGPHLADTIYTLNWAFLALQNMTSLTKDVRYRNGFEKLLGLLLDIQDDAVEKHLAGCWRGMYDIEVKQWGGGDCFEGGAGSIYTGWTNAPIAWGIVNELNGKSLTEY